MRPPPHPGRREATSRRSTRWGCIRIVYRAGASFGVKTVRGDIIEKMVCPRCARENDGEARFCSRCGLDFSKVDFERRDSGETMYCYRHPKRATQLSCGRCEKPVCEDCVVIGPAGPRCPDCAKTNIPIRPAAVGLEVKRFFRGLTRMSPWLLIIGIFLLFNLFRGCFWMIQRPAPVEYPDNLPPIEQRSGNDTSDFEE